MINWSLIHTAFNFINLITVLLTPAKVQKFNWRSSLAIWNKMAPYRMTAMMIKDSFQEYAEEDKPTSLFHKAIGILNSSYHYFSAILFNYAL